MNTTIHRLAKRNIRNAFEILIADYLSDHEWSEQSAMDFADELVGLARICSQEALLNTFKSVEKGMRMQAIDESLNNPKISPHE